MEDTANFVSGDIAKARINGTVEITGLNKSVEGNILTVTYMVDQSQVETVTSVELLDAAGVVLTSSAVYIPVSGATVLKHIIPVSEGVTGNGR